MKFGTHISPDDFIEIQRRVNQKFIVSRKHPTLPYTIYNYTSKTQYERVWDVYTRHCRGLILDDQNKIIVRPFPKIFNFGEPDEFGKNIENIAEKPKYYNKLDGVMGSLYLENGELAIATRGSFDNEQSKFATEWIRNSFSPSDFKAGYTYIFEIIHSTSRIVINYEFTGLVLLAVLSTDGTHELDHIKEGLRIGIGFSRDMLFSNISSSLEFLEEADGRKIEGFVLKYSDGYRIKIKADDYVRMHKLIFRTSSKDIWLAMKENRLESIYEVLPDEMFFWVREIEKDIQKKFNSIMHTANGIAKVALFRYNNTKDVAKYVNLFPEKAVAFRIIVCKKKEAEELAWKMVKPKHFKFSDGN